MKRLTTLALLAGMLSAPALHSEEPGSGAAAPLSFPQLNDAADSEPGDEPPAASPEEGASPAAPATAGDAAATAPAPVMPDLPPPVSGTAAPEVIPVAPVWGGDLNLAQMGMPDGIILSGGQRQGGVSFTLPADQVVIHSQLSLAVRVSPEMASRNATLQLMLNGQPLGTLPLGADGEDVSHYQLDIPPALMVSSNNLSVKINDGDTLQCQRDIHDTSRVTVLPTSHFSWESQQLNISDDLSHFPRPFFDSMQMTPADIALAYGAKPSADVFSAAALISSWLGIQADYRGIAFSALRDRRQPLNALLVLPLLPIIAIALLIKGRAARWPMSLLLWGCTFGHSEARLQTLQADFVRWFRDNVTAFPLVQERLTTYLLSSDADIWLITGSPQPLVEAVYFDTPWLPRVNLIASQIQRGYGGWVLTMRCLGHEKVAQLERKIGTPLRLYSGYSDSNQDNPLLYFCQHRWRVTPRGELQQLE